MLLSYMHKNEKKNIYLFYKQAISDSISNLCMNLIIFKIIYLVCITKVFKNSIKQNDNTSLTLLVTHTCARTHTQL